SSAGRQVSTLGGAHYTASKAGMLGLTRAAAKELGKFGITVNAVCPGMIDTELTREHASPELLEGLAASYPVPRLGTALEVAIVAGVAIAASGNATLIAAADAVAPIGTLWVNAIRMTVIPLVISLLITGVASAGNIQAVGRMGGRTLLVFVLLLTGMAIVVM